MSKNQCICFKINSCNIESHIDILCVSYGNHTTAGNLAKLLCGFFLSVKGKKVIKSLFDLSESLRS